MSRKLILILISAALIALVGGIYATLSLWLGNVSVIVASPDVGVYWDASATSPANTIDFGSLLQGAKANVTLYVKNKGSTAIAISYNSTLSSVSNGNLTDAWTSNGQSLHGISLSPGQVIATIYSVDISWTAPPQSYNWQITLGV